MKRSELRRLYFNTACSIDDRLKHFESHPAEFPARVCAAMGKAYLIMIDRAVGLGNDPIRVKIGNHRFL